jgi:hypothetical protein
MNSSHRRVNEEVKKILSKNLNKESAFDGTVLEGSERRYTILNMKDIQKYGTTEQVENMFEAIDDVQTSIHFGREKDGKKPYNSYIIINVDEPYIDEIIDVMKRNGHW